MKTVLVMFAILGFSYAQAEVKYGFVDMQKAIQSTAEGKKAKSDLEADFKKKKAELEKKEGDLKKLQEDVEKKKAVLSEDALQKKQAEFQEEMMKYQQAMSKGQMEIQKKEQDLTKPILDKMRKVLEKFAKDKGYTAILEKNALVLYSENSADVTDEIVKAFEATK